MARKISLGIVGVGAFGQGFVQLFRDHPCVRRIALCDLDSARLASVAGRFKIAETYASLDDICKTDIEALAIITQPWLHAPQAIAAMRAGKHVYSAVPIISLPDGDQMLDWCDKLIRTCTQTGMHYMMGETSQYRPEAMYCRRRAAAAAFGHFVLAEGEYFHDVDDPGCNLRDVAKARLGKHWDISKSGGVPMHYPTHSLGGLLSVMKAHAVSVSAIGYAMPNDDWFRPDAEAGNVFGDETALFRLSNNAAVRLCEYRRIGHYGREAFQLLGTEGSFTDGPGGCHWVTRHGAQAVPRDEMRDPLPAEVVEAWQHSAGEGKDFYGGHGGSHAFLVHEFVDAVANGRSPAINAWVAARYFVPGIMAHKSALRDGELLKVPDWGDGPA
ncbi:MAG: Gfo/Idh/MocA family oxidoreductase [Planctomycetota bacterium]|nr:Gfo/Idh/MocA family oxidoreductase [Planctomycetota bacterium]